MSRTFEAFEIVDYVLYLLLYSQVANAVAGQIELHCFLQQNYSAYPQTALFEVHHQSVAVIDQYSPEPVFRGVVEELYPLEDAVGEELVVAVDALEDVGS